MPIYRALYDLWTSLGGEDIHLARLSLALAGVSAFVLVLMPHVDVESRAECGIIVICSVAFYAPMVATEATLRLHARQYASNPVVPPLVTVTLVWTLLDVVRSAARIGPAVPAPDAIADLSSFMFGWFLAVLVLSGRERQGPRKRDLPEALRRRFASFVPQPVPSH